MTMYIKKWMQICRWRIRVKQNIMIVIPSLNPDDLLIEVIDSVTGAGYNNILIVDDGSDELHQAPFDYAKERGLIVLRHEINRGKGYALRTAFRYMIENKPLMSAITVDGDNQHKVEDIDKCAKALYSKEDKVIIGCRDFKEAGVPFRSRFGNNMTRAVFRIFCGIKLSDTQTGLRAIPAKYLSDMLLVEGDRYEYETNMLLYMKSHAIAFSEIKIKTIYIEDNSSSHFNPIKDSIRIYKVIFKFVMNSFVSSIIDLSVFYLICMLLKGVLKRSIYIFVATAFARVVSSLCNYFINHKIVFESKGRMKHTIIKYYTLCVCQMMVSYALVFMLSVLFRANGGIITIIKFVVDTLLFFISFRIQRNWVYKD